MARNPEGKIWVAPAPPGHETMGDVRLWLDSDHKLLWFGTFGTSGGPDDKAAAGVLAALSALEYKASTEGLDEILTAVARKAIELRSSPGIAK